MLNIFRLPYVMHTNEIFWLKGISLKAIKNVILLIYGHPK